MDYTSVMVMPRRQADIFGLADHLGIDAVLGNLSVHVDCAVSTGRTAIKDLPLLTYDVMLIAVIVSLLTSMQRHHAITPHQVPLMQL